MTDIIEAVARAIWGKDTFTNTDAPLEKHSNMARAALSVATPLITEKVLREMMDHIGHGKKIFPYLTVKDWLLAFAHERYGITLDGDEGKDNG